MKKYKDKVVAITGAASGIGKEIVMQLAKKGAKFSLGDIDAENLAVLQSELQSKGVESMAVTLDVSKYDQMQNFADKTFQKFGTVDYVFNNAGISAVGNAWKMPLTDWEWLLDVNFRGVVHGIKAFIPLMITQDKECYFINTASAAGFVTGWGGAAYAASKHGVIAISETLEIDLQKAGAKVKSYVICPGYVISNLHNALDHRPDDQWDKNDPAYQDKDYLEAMERSITSTSKTGMPTSEAVASILKQLDEDKFVIMTHDHIAPWVENRYRNLVAGKRPEFKG